MFNLKNVSVTDSYRSYRTIKSQHLSLKKKYNLQLRFSPSKVDMQFFYFLLYFHYIKKSKMY